jgi:hypothetical protein
MQMGEVVCRKFEGFVGNLGGFAPPTPPPVTDSRFGVASVYVS